MFRDKSLPFTLSEMYLLHDLADGGLLPFSQNEIAMSSIGGAIAILSGLVTLIVIVALVNQRKIPNDSFFIISLAVSDLFYSIVVGGMSITNASAGGWLMGKTGNVPRVIRPPLPSNNSFRIQI